MIAFIDDHRTLYGVEPNCRVLPIAPSTYRAHAARRADPGKRPPRAKRDAAQMVEIQRVHAVNFGVDGVWKVWRQLAHEGIPVARCTVAQLMRALSLAGVVRGRRVRTTVPDPAAACPLDQINRQCKAECPNRLWVADFTDVATRVGFGYVAFFIDAFARRIVGWRESCSARTDFVLDALEQALHERRPFAGSGLVCQSDRGSQYVSSATPNASQRPPSNRPSAVSATRTINALAETIIGLSKTDVIHRRGPWRSFEAVE